MRIRKIQVEEILSFLGDDVVSVDGDYHGKFVDNLADVRHVCKTTLDWIKDSDDAQRLAAFSLADVLLVSADVVYDDELKRNGKVLIHVLKPKMALAKVGNYFFIDRKISGIHPTAIISGKAIIGKDVYVGPYTVIGAANIGDGCEIDANVRIYNDVTIGSECKIKAGAVIGGEGFGFEKDENGNRFRFPQIGGVVIGNHVEIGANTCIDRGALSDTVIGDYTKINNLCHIAHNNQIGRNVVITGCVNISGSNIIEDDVWIAPNASIRGYVHLGKGSLIGMGAVVVKDVPAGETWVGNPAKKIEKNRR